MKKGIIIIGLVTIFLTGCNRQIIDANYTFKYAEIKMAGYNELIEIKSWCDYEESDMIQITSTDGKVYLTHSSNVILTNE